MDSSSLDWTIQSSLSSLFPPFEATAPTVLSQLFRTIEERYHGDALQCLLDFLIPAKHILESVQQAACAEYSDVLFRCEGWPLCLGERVVIQLAPINPLLLRPGDFYLQVEAFGEQSARIVLKSLLVQEDLLEQEDLALQAGFRAQDGPAIEETPIPETTYSCIFTEAWLYEVNEGRDGNKLHQCVLSSDHGIVKVPWTEVINPEFLDRPKVKIKCETITSCPSAVLMKQDNYCTEQEAHSEYPVNLSYSETETMIPKAKDGVAVSTRLTESSNRLVKVDPGGHVSSLVGKPVGWVSPNSWDSRRNREVEGEYVDLLDFAKEKESLGLKAAVLPSVPMLLRPAPPHPKRDGTSRVQALGAMDEHCVPCLKNHQLSYDLQKELESKGRHRESYLAAIRNPVCFEKTSVMVPLDETWPGLGEGEPGYHSQGLDLEIDSSSISPNNRSIQPGQDFVQDCEEESTTRDQNMVQMNVNPKHHKQLSTHTSQQPKHFFTEKLPDDSHKIIQEYRAVNKQQCLIESTWQDPHQTQTNVQKHPKSQNLPKMGLGALPDRRSHRQKIYAYRCQGSGVQQINQFHCGPASPHNPFQQPTDQRPLFDYSQNNQNIHQDHKNHMDHSPFCQNLDMGGNSAQVLKRLSKNRYKTRSASSLSETAKECLPKDRPTTRSRSDVCPEIISMVSGVHVQPNKKFSAFGLVSPKLDRRKAAKNDFASSGTSEIPSDVHGEETKSPLNILSAAQSQVLCPGHGSQLTHLSQDPTVKNILQLGIICLPGGRDRTGRAVLEVHGKKKGWASSLLSPLELYKLVLYLHSVPRREVKEMGLTVVIDSRTGSLPSALYKALVIVQEQTPHAVNSVLLLVDKEQSPRPERPPGLQMDIVTSLKALHKHVDGQQLTSELGGTFPYNHMDWLQFYQKLSLFELELQGAALLLHRAIKKLDSNKKIDTAQDVKSCIEEQKSSMKEVLEDTQMVTLQREGGAILARMRKEECKFVQSEDYRDSIEAIMTLYNQVEEGVHTLVMRSNQSLQHLEHVLLLRETERQLNTSIEWCQEKTRRWTLDNDLSGETRERLEQKLQDLHAVLTQGKERKEKGMSVIKDAARRIQDTCYPETDVFHSNVTKFKTSIAAFLLQAEQCKSDLEAFIRLHHFCEQALALSEECSYYLKNMDMGCCPGNANIIKLHSFQERFKAFLPEHFAEERSYVVSEKHPREIRVLSEAWSVCQHVRKKLAEAERNYNSSEFSQKGEEVLRNTGNTQHAVGHFDCHYKPDRKPMQGVSSPLVVSEIQQKVSEMQIKESQIFPLKPQHPPPVQRSSTDNDLAMANKTEMFSREHHSEADLTSRELPSRSDRTPRSRALGRSRSEGSCVRLVNFISTPFPDSECKNHSPGNPKVSQGNQKCAACPQGSLCSDFFNMQLDWTQMGIRDKALSMGPLDDQDSQLSRQESFCSSVSSPRQGWMEEGERSGIHLNVSDSLSGELRSSGRLQDSSELENSSNVLKLQHIIEELLQTEREYVKALGYVMEHYFPELERQDVPQDLRGQRGSIFGNLEKLREFHQHHFLKELELCLKEPFRVGRCFLRHKESFGLYALYSKNKPRSDQLLINHGKEFFKQKQQQLGDKMDLSSYLLKPVQRISKYSLLLQDMLHECDSGLRKGSERAEIQAALKVIQFQLRHGNNLLAMDDIQECDVNLKEQGQLIHQDEFLVSYRKKKCYRHIFLFQDLILFSKTKKTEVGNDTYIYKQSFKTSDIGMTHNSGDSGLCFEIWFRRRKSHDTYTFQARSEEVKDTWTKDLERILWEQAIHNRDIRMQERVFMGIGSRPFMDIKPSEAAICDRAVNCAPTGRECKATTFTGMSDTQGGFSVWRPNSTSSASYVSSCSHSSSSSSGRGSVSPGAMRLETPAVDRGRFSNPGGLEEYDLERENGGQNLVESSESSGESVSGFSSSAYSCQSVIVGSNEEHLPEVPVVGGNNPCPLKSEKNNLDPNNKPLITPKPQKQKREQPLNIVEGNNLREKSTEV
ncbi:quattro [Trichomycterus rosablanca]|uniref:quattro n=1 Tax=Trichomycterus rosablanca TaxID=2290929 RepID=UPI002F35DB64